MKLLKTSWVLSCCNGTTGALVAEYELLSFDSEKWRELLQVSLEDDMLGGYRVLPEHIQFVQQYLPKGVDIVGFKCTIELCGSYEWGH